MELSTDENCEDFNLSLEDELLSIDRLLEQANAFLHEFNTPPANSTINGDETTEDLTGNNESIVNISESIQETATNQGTPPAATLQHRQENHRLGSSGDDDVICLEVANPPVIDYINLCSPSPMQSRIHCGTKRGAKGRRNQLCLPNPVTIIEDNVAGEPEDKRAKEITCRICFESLFDRVTMSTACGHMFCKICLDQVLKTQKRCPMCKQPLNRNRVFRIYL